MDEVELSKYLEQDLTGLIIQYLTEKGYIDAAHKLIIRLIYNSHILDWKVKLNITSI
jgi:hypothetical protein